MTAEMTINADRVGLISQIIVGAMIAGVVIFAAIAFLAFPVKRAEEPMFGWIAAAAAALALGARAVVPRLVANSAATKALEVHQVDPRRALAPIYQTKVILGSALLEGTAFFAVITYLIEGYWVGLVTAGVLVLVMAVTFPSQGQFERWVTETSQNQDF